MHPPFPLLFSQRTTQVVSTTLLAAMSGYGHFCTCTRLGSLFKYSFKSTAVWFQREDYSSIFVGHWYR